MAGKCRHLLHLAKPSEMCTSTYGVPRDVTVEVRVVHGPAGLCGFEASANTALAATRNIVNAVSIHQQITITLTRTVPYRRYRTDSGVRIG